MNGIFYHKAIDMTLVDWFATFAPKPNEASMQRERCKDSIKAKDSDNFVMRSDIDIRCELQYRWAEGMMKARGKHG